MICDWVGAGRGALTMLCFGGLSGCIGAAAIPGGPLQGSGTSVGMSYGYATSSAHITMQSKDGRRDYYDDNAGDALNAPILPSRLGGRVGIGRYVDVAGDLSYLDSGFELRAGLPEGAQPFPMALSLGVRSGHWGLIDLENRESNEQRLRFEAYPKITQYESARFNLIATLGASIGRRFHPLSLPGRFQTGSHDDEFASDVNPRILRDETRLEGSLGCEMRQHHFFTSLVLMPYVVTGSSHMTAICRACADWQPENFRSYLGSAVFFSFGASFLFSDLDKE